MTYSTVYMIANNPYAKYHYSVQTVQLCSRPNYCIKFKGLYCTPDYLNSKKISMVNIRLLVIMTKMVYSTHGKYNARVRHKRF